MSDIQNQKFKNYVQKDGVIKEHEHFDKKLRDKDAWRDFNLYKVTLDVVKEEGYTEEQYKALVHSCVKNKSKDEPTEWKLKPCEKYPKTTAGEIGWRHFKQYHNLEIYGKLYTSPKLTMIPLYEQSEVIFLG